MQPEDIIMQKIAWNKTQLDMLLYENNEWWGGLLTKQSRLFPNNSMSQSRLFLLHHNSLSTIKIFFISEWTIKHFAF